MHFCYSWHFLIILGNDPSFQIFIDQYFIYKPIDFFQACNNTKSFSIIGNRQINGMLINEITNKSNQYLIYLLIYISINVIAYMCIQLHIAFIYTNTLLLHKHIQVFDYCFHLTVEFYRQILYNITVVLYVSNILW